MTYYMFYGFHPSNSEHYSTYAKYFAGSDDIRTKISTDGTPITITRVASMKDLIALMSYHELAAVPHLAIKLSSLFTRYSWVVERLSQKDRSELLKIVVG